MTITTNGLTYYVQNELDLIAFCYAASSGLSLEPWRVGSAASAI